QTNPTAARQTQTNETVKRLGRFEIRGRLGSGAFGTVYRAHDPQLDREVALKVPHAARLGNPHFVKRFLNEAKLAARLQHPHIVPVFDAGRDGKRYYIASAFIEGGTLDAALRKRTLDYRETAGIVMQLAEALAYAHKQKIIHRDVKPDNVMLDVNAEPHLMDFGLARLETSDERLTQGGGILGTPAYMSPEQARGDQDDAQESDETENPSGVTAASDQYSLGATLYEMLCGELPFNGPPEVVIFNVIQTEPPKPRSVNADIPPDLETICQKAMSKEPSRRYTDCAALADDLHRWLADEPIQARQLSPLERAQRWGRRNPVVAGLSGSIVLVVLLALVLVTWQWRRAIKAQAVAVKSQTAADESQAKADRSQTAADKSQAEADKSQAEVVKSKSDRTVAQVDSILRSDIRQLPLIIKGLQPFWSDVLQRLEQYESKKDLTSAERLRLNIALVSHDEAYVEPLKDNLLTCNPNELTVIRDALFPYRDDLKDELWDIVNYSDANRNQQFRAACALATFDPESFWWADASQRLVRELVLENPLVLQTWLDALRPVRTVLLKPLESMLEDRIAATSTEDEVSELLKRKANVAGALLMLDEPDKAWSLLKHSPDPQARSYLIHSISSMNVEAQTLIGRLETEPDVSIRRALLLALGEFSKRMLTLQQRQPVIDKVLALYERDPDPGIHGAAEWLLRQWGATKQLDAIDARLRANETKLPQGDDKRQWYLTTQGQTMVILNADGFLMGSPETEPDRQPDETLHRRTIGRKFAIASKEVTKAQFRAFERANPAIAPVEIEETSKTDDSPQLSVDWYNAAAYCNWLNEQEGIPQQQWCYLPKTVYNYPHGIKRAADYLKRTGYRLPTEDEWEFACRAACLTSRYYGPATTLLSKYAWHRANSRKRSWPVGRLKPNDFGLFDMLGNAEEWCDGRYRPYEGEGELIYAMGILRGGSFNDQSSNVRSARRGRLQHNGFIFQRRSIQSKSGTQAVGFRPARTYPEPLDFPAE
ncbi:MAG: SUMF1/EgtB/PvdO family nonheme iron enzyme, partial [Planctomycetaceae bacterium]|nr:SUMF1/EgtB/PvdO family nonheme iron enzyme [Planctomycetaceae bacterium]